MPASIFINQEKEYLRWLSDHPKGFVVNTNEKPRTNYMVLHTSQCRLVKENNKMAKRGGFTERGYIKICSDDPDHLLAWIETQGGTDFSKKCSKCKPDVSTAKILVRNNNIEISNHKDSNTDLYTPTCEDLQSTRRQHCRPGDKVSEDTIFDWYEKDTKVSLQPKWRDIVRGTCNY